MFVCFDGGESFRKSLGTEEKPKQRKGSVSTEILMDLPGWTIAL